MNLCVTCGLDFGSVKAFDRHRVGRHEYTFAEGMVNGLDDGRRCLDEDEIRTLTDKAGRAAFAQDSRGRWTLAGHQSVGERLRGGEAARQGGVAAG